MGIPLLFWNLLRTYFGDYYTLLMSTIPGVIYAIVTFVQKKEHRITGYIFFLGMLVARLMDLLVSTSEGILWNDVRVNMLYVILWSSSIVFGKPVGLYFFLDYASYSGLDYQKSKEKFSKKPFIKYFYRFTFLLLLQDLFMAILYTVLIRYCGIDYYNKIIVITGIFNYLNIGMITLFVIYIIKRIK